MASSSGFRQSPGHLKMRKGTRSCFECRRRKTKCIYLEGGPSKCKECHARGTPCVDQDKGPLTTSHTHTSPLEAENNAAEAKYSLRERVARLEDFVQEQVNKQNASTTAGPWNQYIPHSDPLLGTSNIAGQAPDACHYHLRSKANLTPTGQAHSPETSQFEPRPMINLFNNALIAQAGQPIGNSLTGLESSAFHPARYELLTLLPHEPDLNTLVELSKDWWNSKPYIFPELFSSEETAMPDWRSVLNQKLSLPNPAETAKVLIWTLISAERLDENIMLDSAFRDPTALATFGPRLLPLIDRLIVFDDLIGTTLPGVECLVLLSRYHCNHGRLQKAWHLCRRAIDLSISTGIHRASVESKGAHRRRAELWQAGCFLDSYLSLLLGLPHGIRDPRLQVQEKSGSANQGGPQEASFFYFQITSIIDRLIDRNQKRLEESEFLLQTLQINQDLRDISNDLDTQSWDADPGSSNPYMQEASERIEAYFLLHFVQALLHLPLMLKCIGERDKGMCQFSYGACTGSSRQALVAHKYLRVGLHLDPYFCTMLDLQAFMVSVLLILHLLGKKTERHKVAIEEHTPDEQDERDWESVTVVTEVLRKVSNNKDQSHIAAQAVKVLDLLMRAKNVPGGVDFCPRSKANGGIGCRMRITIPCFGDITLVQGLEGIICFCATPSVGVEKALSPTALTIPGEHVSGLDPFIFDITLPSPHDIAAAYDGNWDVLRGNVASVMADV